MPNRSDRARQLFGTCRCSWVVRDHQPAFDRRPIPRTLADLPIRTTGSRRDLLHRLCRHDAAQPQQSSRGAGAGERSQPQSASRRNPRRRALRRCPGVAGPPRRELDKGCATSGHRYTPAAPGPCCPAGAGDVDLADDSLAWEANPDGSWTIVFPNLEINDDELHDDVAPEWAAEQARYEP